MPPAKELPAGATDQNPPKKKKSRFKLVMLLSSLLLLLGAIGGGGYWWLYMRPGAEGLGGLFSSAEPAGSGNAGTEGGGEPPALPPAGQGADGAAPAASGGEAGPASAVPKTRAAIRPISLPALTVNLADPSGSRYLEIGMDVEVNNPAAVQEIENQTARVRDAIILLLSSKTIGDLATAEGKIVLKNEVAARLNQILGTQRIVRIYFTHFVIR
jgi:flagellar FliL protein